MEPIAHRDYGGVAIRISTFFRYVAKPQGIEVMGSMAGRSLSVLSICADRRSINREYRPGLPEHSRRFFEVYFALARAGLTNAKRLPSIWQIAVEMRVLFILAVRFFQRNSA
jgi:hypothetical protein